jgi:hypothetical protein
MIRGLTLALVLLLASAGPAHAALEDRTEDPLAADAEEAMWYGDFDALEKLYARAQATSEVNPVNGRSAVGSVRAGMSSAFKYGELDDFYFRELERLTARWAQERPRSALARLLYARALYARAWHVRGGGYWRTVPEPAKAEFQQLIGRAQKQITDHVELLAADTTMHLYLVMIGRSASWPLAQLRAVVEDGVARSNRDELELYEELVFSMLPKWGGDADMLADFIDRVDARTRGRLGQELYALLWSKVADNVEGNLYKTTRAEWPRMKAGFERLSAKFSHRWFAHRLAYFACLGDDRQAMKGALARVQGEPDVDAWSGGGAGGQQNYEACMRWAAEPAAKKPQPDAKGRAGKPT